MTSGDNNFNYFPENQLTKFSAKLLINFPPEHMKCSFTHRGGRWGGGSARTSGPLDPPLLRCCIL